jgi:hypothetical protein
MWAFTEFTNQKKIGIYKSGWWFQLLWKMMDFVSWDYCSHIWKNHPAMFQSPPITSAPMSQTSPWPPWPVDENGMTPPPQGHHVSNLTIRLRFESDSGRRPTDTEPGFHERHGGFIGFHQLDILCYMVPKIMPGIISTIQWGNNP